jgi:hypothetical protein
MNSGTDLEVFELVNDRYDINKITMKRGNFLLPLVGKLYHAILMLDVPARVCSGRLVSWFSYSNECIEIKENADVTRIVCP